MTVVNITNAIWTGDYMAEFVRVVFALVYDEFVVSPGDTEDQLFRIIPNLGRILKMIRIIHNLWINFSIGIQFIKIFHISEICYRKRSYFRQFFPQIQAEFIVKIHTILIFFLFY